MSFKKEVVDKLVKIEIQLGVNNRILDEHHKRSTLMEERIKPLEASHVFFNKLSKAIIAFIAIIASIASIYSYLVK